jgi:exonuclease I
MLSNPSLVDGTMSTATYTREQILSETQQIHDGTLCRHDSKIYKAWSDMATDWLSDTDDYLYEGFIGFADRSEETILEDFRLNDMLAD